MEKLKCFLDDLGKLFPEKSEFLRDQLKIVEDEIEELKKRNKKLQQSLSFQKSDQTKVRYVSKSTFLEPWDQSEKKTAKYFDLSMIPTISSIVG